MDLPQFRFYHQGSLPAAMPAWALVLEPEWVRAMAPVLGKQVASWLEERILGGARPALALGSREVGVQTLPEREPSARAHEQARKCGAELWNWVHSQGWKQWAWIETPLAHSLAEAFIEGFLLSAYHYGVFQDNSRAATASQLEIWLPEPMRAGMEKRRKIIAAQCWARDLVNTPPAHLTADLFAHWMYEQLEPLGVEVRILRKAQLQALKMGGLLGVNRGSQDEPTFTILEWRPQEVDPQSEPLVLVGKGVTYDSGGLNLKSGEPMAWMKSDMAGAAAVAGAIMGVAALSLPRRIIGLIPATDNRPGEKALAPGDVLRMMDGTTVEVMNTDAEGRLILADALSYARTLQPALMVDLATLTGSAYRALGEEGAVYFSTAPEALGHQLEAASQATYERVHPFPLWPEYAELLRSDSAQMKNVGPPEAGAISAAKFLEHFAGDLPWMHIDMAGVAFRPGGRGYRGRGGSGFGVRLLLHFLEHLEEEANL